MKEVSNNKDYDAEGNAANSTFHNKSM